MPTAPPVPAEGGEADSTPCARGWPEEVIGDPGSEEEDEETRRRLPTRGGRTKEVKS